MNLDGRLIRCLLYTSYTDVELRKNTDVNTGWLSSEPLTQYEYLTKLDGSKVAISVTIPTFAKGGSGKVEAGDIIMLFATDKDTGETTQPPELKYVEVLAATQSSGADKEYQAVSYTHLDVYKRQQ